MVATSSGEAEWYAKVGVAVETLQIARLLQWIGLKVNMELKGDSTAAAGIANRLGAGKMKHIEIKTLWLQRYTTSEIKEDQMIDGYVNTNVNPADIGTKPHPRQRLIELMRLCSMKRISEQDTGKLEEVTQDLKTDQFKGVMKTPASTRKVAAMVVAAVSAASSVQKGDSANAADVHDSGNGIVPNAFRAAVAEVSLAQLLMTLMAVYGVVALVRDAWRVLRPLAITASHSVDAGDDTEGEDCDGLIFFTHGGTCYHRENTCRGLLSRTKAIQSRRPCKFCCRIAEVDKDKST